MDCGSSGRLPSDPFRAQEMARAAVNTTFDSSHNAGAQIGHNAGSITNIFPGQPASPRPSPSIVIPLNRDHRHFVPRPVLDQVLAATSQPASRVALVGLGGVGKTQLAAEYAYRRHEANAQSWVFWVHASSMALFEKSYRQIAQRVCIGSDKDSSRDILSAVYNWLCDEHNGSWTMVVDNADSDEIVNGINNDNTRTTTNPAADSKVAAAADNVQPLANYLPRGDHGSILITTRSRVVARGLIDYPENIFNVGLMNEKDAVLLLTNKLQKTHHNTDNVELQRLVRELDYIPLAITQAAAYLNQLEGQCTIAQYLNTLVKSNRDRQNLLQHNMRDPRRDVLDKEASNSIMTTWHISFAYIRQTRDSAARLLALACLFNRDSIAKTLLNGHYSSSFRSDLTEDTDEARDEFEFRDDVALLGAYNLLAVGTDGSSYSMHRLVQLSTQLWLEIHNELSWWQCRYINILDRVFPEGDYANWPVCQALFAHVEVLTEFRPVDNNSARQRRAEVLCRGAWYIWQSGRYNVAAQMARESLEEREVTLGTNATQTFNSLDILGILLNAQGKYSEAEEIHKRALAGYTKELGASHCNTLASLGNLADALCNQGRYSEAEEIYRQALAEREKKLGASHPDTLASVYDLAYLTHTQQDYTQSLQLYNRAVQGYIDVLGPAHPTTVSCREDRQDLLQERKSNSSKVQEQS